MRPPHGSAACSAAQLRSAARCQLSLLAGLAPQQVLSRLLLLALLHHHADLSLLADLLIGTEGRFERFAVGRLA